MKDFPKVTIESREQWRQWLADNHATADTIWLVRWKKGTGKPHLDYDAVVEEALCFGWIDATIRALNAEQSMLMLSPRRPGSPWSALNKRRVAALEKSAKLLPAGIAAIDRAKRDGTWTILDDVEALIAPPDLLAALSRDPAARSAYDAFAPSARKGLLWWIKSAKTPTTRADRIAKTVAAAREGWIANQPKSQSTRNPSAKSTRGHE